MLYRPEVRSRSRRSPSVEKPRTPYRRLGRTGRALPSQGGRLCRLALVMTRAIIRVRRSRTTSRRSGRTSRSNATVSRSRSGTTTRRATPASCRSTGADRSGTSPGSGVLRRRLLVPLRRHRALRGRARPRHHGSDHAPRHRDLPRLRDVGRLPRLAYRPDARPSDPFDLRRRRLVARLVLHHHRAARLGRFQANLLVQIWDGLYGWGNVEPLTVALGRRDGPEQPLRVHRASRSSRATS